MAVEVEHAAVEHAAAYLRAVKNGEVASIGEYAAKGAILDSDASTIAGFIGGTGADVAVAKMLSQAELYWYFADHHPWIGSATELIAKTIAGAGFDIVAPGVDRDQDTVDADPCVVALRAWLAQVNPEQSVEDLVEELSLDLDITGTFFVHVNRLPGNKKIVGLERIDSRTIAPVLSDDGRKIAKFVQKTRVRGQVVTTEYGPADIIFGKRAGGKDILGRGSPIEQLDLTLGVDWSARKMGGARFRNGVRAGIVLINKKLDKPQLEENKKTMEQHKAGSDKAAQPLVLAGDWDVYFPPQGDDEEFGKAMDRARQEVCATYHIPEAKLITTEGALGGNGKEADDQTFHEECIRPRARAIWRTLSRRIIAEFVAAGATSLAGLEMQPKAKYTIRASMIDSAVKWLQAGGTINESRAMCDAPKSAVKKGVDLDMPIVAGLLKSAKNALAAPTPPGAGLPKPGGDKPADDPEGQPAKKAGARDGGHTEALATYVAGHHDDVDAGARRLTKKLRRARKAMIAAFADAAGLSIAVKSATDDSLPISQHAIDAIKRAINELDAGAMGEAIFDEVEVLYDLGWDRARVLLDIETGLNEPPVATINRLRADADAFSFLVENREKAALRDALTTALETGQSTEHVAAALRQVFADGFHVDGNGHDVRETASGRVINADAWTEMVARTELSRASNSGAFDFYEAAGLTKVRWIASGGDNCCDECDAADEEVVDIGEDFAGVGVSEPPAHPNCACAIAPADDELGDARGSAEDRRAAARGNNPDDSEE